MFLKEMTLLNTKEIRDGMKKFKVNYYDIKKKIDGKLFITYIMGKLKIEINDIQNIRDLLQETYKLADEQIIQAQNEINKLSNATKLQDEVMDSKSKYAKAINDYLGMKDKAIAKKLDIAKILSEIYKYNGDVKGALGS